MNNMPEYQVIYKLNGVRSEFYVTVETKLPLNEIRFSIVKQLKLFLKLTANDTFKIINIKLYNP